MPKLKTHSGAKKRVKPTKSGQVMRRHASGNHFLEKKTGGRKRQFRVLKKITGKSKKNIKRQLKI